MRVVGLNNEMYISSAALLENGRIVAAAAEERFSRQKHTRNFPARALQWCLKSAGCAPSDVDAFAVHWNPGAYLGGFNPLISSHRRFKAEYLYSVPDYLSGLFGRRPAEHIEQRLMFPGAEVRIFYIDHHCAHIANAYYLSPFQDAAVLTADGQGERDATTYSVCRDGEIQLLQRTTYPQSLGLLYSSITEYLGFRPNCDEWKVMALGAFADAGDSFDEHFATLIRERPEGMFEIDLTYFSGYNWDEPRNFTSKLEVLLGPARRPDDPIEDRHCAIAAGLQTATERCVFHALGWLWEETQLDNLAVSGGLFMNCVLNAKIARETRFRRVFISSCPDDSGNSIGAALWVYHQLLGAEGRFPQLHNYYGPEYGDEAIEDELKRYRVSGYRYVENVEEEVAGLLAAGRLIGWFQGRMEFGQRALGNRSILADPRQPDMKHRINRAVKFREAFRPFAPSVLEERASEFFDIPSDEVVPFMEKAYSVREEKRSVIPAVLHADGSARLQTVSMDTNRRYHRLITYFGELTDVPLLLNTSFNLNGEPIVEHPRDAIRTFYSSGLETLVMGNLVVDK